MEAVEERHMGSSTSGDSAERAEGCTPQKFICTQLAGGVLARAAHCVFG